MNSDYVILSVRGWDGSRLLGVFESKDAAKKAVADHMKERGEPTTEFLKMHKEEYFLDVVKSGVISVGSTMSVNGESITGENTESYDVIVRTHLYS